MARLAACLLVVSAAPALAQSGEEAGLADGDSASPPYSEGLEDLEAVEALEREMLDGLLPPDLDEALVEGPYEGLSSDDPTAGIQSVTDVPRAGRTAPRTTATVRAQEPAHEVLGSRGEPDSLVPLAHFDLDGIEPVFGLDSLDHAPIHAYLEFWTGPGRRRMARLLARSGRYKTLIEDAVSEAGLPTELLYLVMIESGYDTTAVSRSGAVGLWQFIPRTGRGYGLEIGRRYDERRDPELATGAAIEYLGSLYERFGSWPLAMAGYNAGGGHVGGELRRYNLNDFWRLDSYSAVYDDTRRYVYKIIAAAIIGQNPDRFGFEGVVLEEPPAAEVVDVPGNTRLRVFARAAETDVDTLMALNPALRVASTPDVETYALRIPRGSLGDFVDNYDDYVPGAEGEQYIHRLRVGDSVESLADLFGVSERVLRYANGLDRRERPAYGTDLVVPIAAHDAESRLALEPGAPPDESDRQVVITPPLQFVYADRDRVFYLVCAGDDLATVARAFGVSTADLSMWNDLDRQAALLSGMTLQVYLEPGADLNGVRYLPEDHVRALALDSPEYAAWDEAEERRRSSRRRTYTVRRGDTISRIAQRFGVSSRDIVRWNDLDNPNAIRAGQQLRVR